MIGAAPSSIAYLTACELGEAYRSGAVSPVEAAQAALERIEERNPGLNAFCLLDADVTLAQANASLRRFAEGEPLGSLDGVPVAIKDVFLTRGWPTLKGSAAIDPAGPWDTDAPAVARLREAGAVLTGKTTTPELGWKGVTDSPLQGVTRNPWDPDRTPGGSSGGSAAALATGMSPLALGTDGGGSIRIPGGFTGVVGIKPTFGLVPNWPASPFGTLAHAGPMARTVADTALLLDVVAVPDPWDWSATPPPAAPLTESLTAGLEGIRVAFSPTLGYVDFVDPEVAAAVEAAVAALSGAGAVVEEVDPGFDDPRRAFEVLWYAGAAAALDGLGSPPRHEMDPGLLEIAEEGSRFTAVDHVKASQERDRVASGLSRLLDRYDLLVTPTLPIPAFEAAREVPEGWEAARWHTWTPFSLPFNLSQQPAATVPCGLTSDGLPVGLQIAAAKHRDALVLRTAATYESARTDGGHDQFTRPKEKT